MRRPRIDFEGAIHHVTARGAGRSAIVADDGDCEMWVATLARVAEMHGILVAAWCLMPNHYHLVLETPRANLSAAVGRLNWLSARSFNERRKRTGHLYAARFHSTLIARDAHVLAAARYVVLNPVRAGLCRGPARWRWSSYRATAGLDPCPPFLRPDLVLSYLDGDSQRFRDFVRDGVDQHSR